jgi:integrase
VPKLPRNMVRRKGRPGFHFRRRRHGRTTWIALGSDYEEACRRLRSLKTEEEKPRVELTVRDAAERWLESYIATTRGARDQKLARRRVEMHLEPFLGHLLLHRLTQENLRAYRLHLERRGRLSPQSVKHVLSDARCLLNWCEDSGLVDRSPFPRRIMPKIQERPPDRLTDEEVQCLVSLPEPLGFICRLALGTGLRWGELVRATAQDVEDDCLVVSQTKSGKVRRIPLARELLAEIRGRVGKLVAYSPRSSGAFARIVLKLSGLPRFHAHQMRHTFACRWLERGGNYAVIQEILGHSSIVTTQRYARLSHDLVKREAARLEGRGDAKVVAKAKQGLAETAPSCY